MGNKCCKSRNNKKIVILLLGLDNSGKTVIAKGLAGEPRFAVVPTVGFSVYNLRLKSYDIHLYDLGGGKQIRGIWHQYFADAHGLIYVVDSANYERLKESKQILEETLSDERLFGKPLLLLANKQDCSSALDELDIVEKLKIEDLVNLRRCPTLVQCCSATETTKKSTKLDISITKGYAWLISYIENNYWKLNARVERDIREKLKNDLIVQKRKMLLRNERRSTNCSIDWDKENERVKSADPLPSEVKTFDTNISKTNSLESVDIKSNNQITSPQIYFVNECISGDSKPSSSNMPLKTVENNNKSEHKFNIFANIKSNKTAPDTLLEVSSLRSSPNMHRNILPIDRRIKSADTSSQQILNINNFKTIFKSNCDVTDNSNESRQSNNISRLTHSNKVLPFKNGLSRHNKTWISNPNNFDTTVFHIDVDQ